MDQITKVSIGSYTDSKFVNPFRMHYTQNGVDKFWDLVEVHQSVSIIIYNTSRDVMIFVRQFRPPVYYGAIPASERQEIDTKKYPGSLGLTLELCAGVVDKPIPLEEIAREEVLEECGYDVPIANLERVKSYKSVATASDRQTMFYAEVNDTMRVSAGGGIADEGEMIEVVEMTIPEVKEYLKQDEVQSPVGFLFGVTWFLHNKYPFK